MSDILSRREARRRRILENAESRLQKITNSVNDKNYEHKHNLNTEKDPLILEDPAEPDDGFATEEPDLTSIFQNGNFSGSSSTSRPSTPTRADDNNVRVIVVTGLAIFTTILQSVVSKFDYSGDGRLLNKIFAPLLLYEMVDVFLPKRQPELNPLANVLVLFANIPPGISRNMVATLNAIARIMQDLLVYSFIYITSNLLIDGIY